MGSRSPSPFSVPLSTDRGLGLHLVTLLQEIPLFASLAPPQTRVLTPLAGPLNARATFLPKTSQWLLEARFRVPVGVWPGSPLHFRLGCGLRCCGTSSRPLSVLCQRSASWPPSVLHQARVQASLAGILPQSAGWGLSTAWPALSWRRSVFLHHVSLSSVWSSRSH